MDNQHNPGYGADGLVGLTTLVVNLRLRDTPWSDLQSYFSHLQIPDLRL